MKRKELTKLTNEWRNFINETSIPSDSGELTALSKDKRNRLQRIGSFVFTFSDEICIKNVSGNSTIDLSGKDDIQNLNIQMFFNLLEEAQSLPDIDPRNLGTDSELFLQNLLAADGKVTNINDLFTRDNAEFADLVASDGSDGSDKVYWSCKMSDDISNCGISVLKIIKAFLRKEQTYRLNAGDSIGVCWIKPLVDNPGNMEVHLYKAEVIQIENFITQHIKKSSLDIDDNLPKEDKITALYDSLAGSNIASRFSIFINTLFDDKDVSGFVRETQRLADEIQSKIKFYFAKGLLALLKLYKSRDESSSKLDTIEKCTNIFEATTGKAKVLYDFCSEILIRPIAKMKTAFTKIDGEKINLKVSSNVLNLNISHIDAIENTEDRRKNSKVNSIYSRERQTSTIRHVNVRKADDQQGGQINLTSNVTNENIEDVFKALSGNNNYTGEVIKFIYKSNQDLFAKYNEHFESYRDSEMQNLAPGSSTMGIQNGQDMMDRVYDYLSGSTSRGEFKEKFPFLKTLSGGQAQRDDVMSSVVGQAGGKIKRVAANKPDELSMDDARKALMNYYRTWTEIQEMYINSFEEISDMSEEEVIKLVKKLNSSVDELKAIPDAVDTALDGDRDKHIHLRQWAELTDQEQRRTRSKSKSFIDVDQSHEAGVHESVNESRASKSLKDLYKF